MMANRLCLCCGKPIENDSLWHSNCLKKFFGVDYLPELNVTEEELSKLAIAQIQNKKSVAGVQEKLSLHLDLNIKKRPRLTIVGYPSGFILKPQSAKFKLLPEFEHTAMLLAELCNIDVVPHGLIPINDNNELAYITKRIDRVGKEKIHMEDFCQASGITVEHKYRSSYEECADLIKKYSHYPDMDNIRLFTCLYFNYVIGNSDVHLKNFSFIMNDKGELRLASFYDLLPTKVILLSDHDDLGMLFDGRKNNLRKHNFDNFCKKIGIDESLQYKIINSINDKVDKMSEIINNSLLDRDSKSIWIKMIASNIRRAKQP